jgi:hypothetical protein
MVGMLQDTTSSVVMALVSVNAIALVMLAGEGMAEYLTSKESATAPTTKANASRIRLQMMRLVACILTIITVFKILLPADLADSIISAWFVGQGFALQKSLQSLVAGIVLRYDPIVRRVIVEGGGSVQVKGLTPEYTMHKCSMVSITLTEKSAGLRRYVVVEWQSMYHATLIPDA